MMSRPDKRLFAPEAAGLSPGRSTLHFESYCASAATLCRASFLHSTGPSTDNRSDRFPPESVIHPD